MSWTITHSVSSAYSGDAQLVDGLTITHNINPVTEVESVNQIQSDWNQSDDEEVDYIKNKPATFEVFSFAASDESTDLSVGTAKITGHWPYNFVMTSMFIGVSTAPTGSTLIVDFNDKDGNSIFSVNPTIDEGEFTSLTADTPPVISTTTFVKGDKWTIDVDQKGLTIAGKGLKFYIIGTKS